MGAVGLSIAPSLPIDRTFTVQAQGSNCCLWQLCGINGYLCNNCCGGTGGLTGCPSCSGMQRGFDSWYKCCLYDDSGCIATGMLVHYWDCCTNNPADATACRGRAAHITRQLRMLGVQVISTPVHSYRWWITVLTIHNPTPVETGFPRFVDHELVECFRKQEVGSADPPQAYSGALRLRSRWWNHGMAVPFDRDASTWLRGHDISWITRGYFGFMVAMRFFDG